MSLDEDAINAVTDYFESISLNAVNDVHESAGRDTTFAEFMESVSFKIKQFASELVAAEVLKLSASAIENFHGGEGVSVEDVQEIIDSGGAIDADEDEDD